MSSTPELDATTDAVAAVARQLVELIALETLKEESSSSMLVRLEAEARKWLEVGVRMPNGRADGDTDTEDACAWRVLSILGIKE